MMPHAIRRVYVARRARIAASLVVALCGTMLVVTALSPGLAQVFASGLPGINPAVLCTLVIAMWLAGLFTYAAARALDEHRFAVAMSRYVMPSKDLDNDIERLSHEHPDQVARQMAHRLEVKSAALPVLAASVLLPVTALFIVHAFRVKGWPVIAEFEASIAAHGKQLAISGVVGVVTAILMTRRFARLSSMAPIAGAITIATGIGAIVSWHWLATATLLAATITLVVRRLRIERDKLEAEDPAAGSEVFTWRGVVDKVRSTARYLKTRNAKIAIGVCVFLAAAFYNGGSAPQQAQATFKMPTFTTTGGPAPTTKYTASGTKIEAMGDGRIKISFDLNGEDPVVLNDLAGLSIVPPGWSAQVDIESANVLSVTMNGKTLSTSQPVSFSISSCTLAMPSLGVGIDGPAGHYVVYVRPVLEPASC